MSKLNTLKSEITTLLETMPELRESDEKLYAEYLKRHGISYVSVNKFLMNFNTYHVSDFESVTRARRKAMELNPKLKPKKIVEDLRQERQTELIEFAGVRNNG